MNILAILAAAASVAAPQHFVLSGKTVHGHGSPIHVTATGPISGVGVGTAVHLKNGSDRTTIRFAKGTVVISSHQTAFSAKPNPRTCTAAILERGEATPLLLSFSLQRGCGVCGTSTPPTHVNAGTPREQRRGHPRYGGDIKASGSRPVGDDERVRPDEHRELGERSRADRRVGA